MTNRRRVLFSLAELNSDVDHILRSSSVELSGGVCEKEVNEVNIEKKA